MSNLHEEDMRRRSYDPLRKVSIDSPTLAKSWLANGQFLTPVQRLGYAIFSFAYIGAGLFTLGASIEDFKEKDVFFSLGFGVATAFFFYFGLRGLRNVLRFRRK
ncbi:MULTISPECIES: hypothetical protein [Acidobacteriaceae]|uniref:hypothetical protein n=1 Tax=Acidobacteriaceae TaxID=204434 RepID=UPI00131B3460|nr:MULTISPECIES: hypothetical protein [Acidobacteriaceae]MDW5265016.1 hypothetical protein [Edaphobacter sp.]